MSGSSTCRGRGYARQGHFCKWLDLDRLSRLLLPNDTIHRIRYFTAPIQPRPNSPNQGAHQQIYLRALRTIPHLTIHEGTFRTDPRWMPLETPLPDGLTMVRVLKTEEKGSDVHLATYLVSDAYEKDFEKAVVISNDSDLCTPIRLVRTRLGFEVLVYNPGKRHSSELQRDATEMRNLRRGPIVGSQFASILTDAQGTFTKPRGW
ncbi:MAG: NYN domain-containing protein [Chloroflexota bacterium]